MSGHPKLRYSYREAKIFQGYVNHKIKIKIKIDKPIKLDRILKLCCNTINYLPIYLLLF